MSSERVRVLWFDDTETIYEECKAYMKDYKVLAITLSKLKSVVYINVDATKSITITAQE